MSGKFKFDGKEIPFEAGDTIIRAAARQGIDVPHYCWHPGLSAPANCRMCLVEVKSARPVQLPVLKWDAAKNAYVDDLKTKLTPACQQACAEGMEVDSQNAAVKAAQKSTQEFLLLNHPVDCPICDQAGECKLQDYWLENQHELKRKHTEPVHKVKGVRFGEKIVYDGERCVMCTRCIRFNEEVVGDPVLDMRERGNINEIVLAPGRELDHDYTLMNEHVCPVGALTSRDFRFKARVWFLKSAPSVCGGCATGCNTHVDFDPRTQQVARLRPRDNVDVNKYWMCDDGMLSYHGYHADRVTTGRVNGKPATSRHALKEAGRLLAAAKKTGAKVGVVLSAHHSNEDNLVLAKLARDVLGTDKLYLGAKANWKGDAILRNVDQTPNRKGALAAGAAGAGAAGAAGAGSPTSTLGSLKDLAGQIIEGEVGAVLVLGSHVAETAAELAALGKVPTVALATHNGPITELAAVVVPVTVHVEMDGTFTNAKGVAQAFKRAIHPPAGVHTGYGAVIELARDMDAASFVSSFDTLLKALPHSTEARA